MRRAARVEGAGGEALACGVRCQAYVTSSYICHIIEALACSGRCQAYVTSSYTYVTSLRRWRVVAVARPGPDTAVFVFPPAIWQAGDGRGKGT